MSRKRKSMEFRTFKRYCVHYDLDFEGECNNVKDWKKQDHNVLSCEEKSCPIWKRLPDVEK